MSEMNKAVIRRFMQEIWTASGDLDVADAILDPGYAAWEKPWATIWRRAFPDLVAEVEDLVAEGDKVAAVVTFHGTHTDTLSGEQLGRLSAPIPPTGRRMDHRGIWVFTVIDGVVQHKGTVGVFDFLGLLRQLGSVPAVGEGAA